MGFGMRLDSLLINVEQKLAVVVASFLIHTLSLQYSCNKVMYIAVNL